MPCDLCGILVGEKPQVLKIDMSWRFDKFASTIWKYDSIQYIYILYIHIKLYWKCHALIAALTKRVAGYLYLDLTAASKAAAIPTFHWVRSYHVC